MSLMENGTEGTPIQAEFVGEPFVDIIPGYIGIKGINLIGKLETMGDNNLEKMLDYWIEKYHESMRKPNRTYEKIYPITRKIVLLIEAIRKASERPLLATLRDEKFFEIGEDVLVFKDDKFLSAKIVALREENPYTEMFVGIEFSDGRYAPYAFQRPEILRPDELKALKDDPEFFDQVWLESARDRGWAGFNASLFASALLG